MILSRYLFWSKHCFYISPAAHFSGNTGPSFPSHQLAWLPSYVYASFLFAGCPWKPEECLTSRRELHLFPLCCRTPSYRTTVPVVVVHMYTSRFRYDSVRRRLSWQSLAEDCSNRCKLSVWHYCRKKVSLKSSQVCVYILMDISFQCGIVRMWYILRKA